MKIGVLTLHLYTNYGGILQAYALQTALERMGHEVEFIDEECNYKLYWYLKPLVYTKRLILKYIFHRKDIKINAEDYSLYVYKLLNRNTLPFINKYIKRRFVNKFTDILPSDYNALIAGSDQVWRPLYFRKPIDLAYFSFAKDWNIKRLSYAASFGLDKWEYNSNQTKKCKSLISKFDAVSIREYSGVKLCKKYFGIESIHVLDPTFLVEREDYVSLIKDTVPSEGVLFNYILDENSIKKDLLDHIAKDRKQIPFKVNNPNFDNQDVPIQMRVQPPLEPWLRAFYDSEFIVTDSFHACVFSIIFRKPFAVICNKMRGATRIESLLSMFSIEDRLIETFADYEMIKDKPLPDDVYQKLSLYKAASFDFLYSNLL